MKSFPDRGKSTYKGSEEKAFIECSKNIKQAYVVRQTDQGEA